MNPKTEPALSPWQQRALAAVWISLGLHGAVIALVPATPSAGRAGNALVFDVQLVTAKARPQPVDVAMLETQVDVLDTVNVPQLATTLSLAPLLPPVVPSSPPSAPPSAAETHATPVPAVAIHSGVDLTYYSAREIDVHPRPLELTGTDYLGIAYRKGLSGSVRLQLKLEADGRVVALEVLSASPSGPLEIAALNTYRDARFSSAMRQGNPVRALIVIDVKFDPDGIPDTQDWQ